MFYSSQVKTYLRNDDPQKIFFWLLSIANCCAFSLYLLPQLSIMAAPVITIDKKKYRVIPDEEYRQLLEEIRDLSIILKRKNEKNIDATTFFASLQKKIK